MTDLQILQDDRDGLRIIFKDLSLDYFVLRETKLDENFPLHSLL